MRLPARQCVRHGFGKAEEKRNFNNNNNSSSSSNNQQQQQLTLTNNNSNNNTNNKNKKRGEKENVFWQNVVKNEILLCVWAFARSFVVAAG